LCQTQVFRQVETTILCEEILTEDWTAGKSMVSKGDYTFENQRLDISYMVKY